LERIAQNYLDEGLDSAVFVDLSFIHSSSDTTGITIDASDESLSELFVSSSVIECLHDDGLASSVASAQDEHHFSGFHDFTHVWLCLPGMNNKTF
jgi:hypothetical protein